MPKDIDQDNLRIKFSPLNADFSSPWVGSRRLACASVKKGHLSNKWLFYWY